MTVSLFVLSSALAIVLMRRTRVGSQPGRSMDGGVHPEPTLARAMPPLVKERTRPPRRSPPRSSKPQRPYVAALEDEDDMPTTLYRDDDDPAVEALVTEFDNEDRNQ